MRLLVGPVSAVQRLLNDQRVDHILTLVSPDAEASQVAAPRTLLRFNDIVEARAGLGRAVAGTDRDDPGVARTPWP